MKSDIEQDKEEILQELKSLISRCEKAQLKFKEGCSQYTLLKNRLHALYISKELIEKQIRTYSKEELEKALPPILSIIHKCTKAQSKYEAGTAQYNRYLKTLRAMELSKELIEESMKNL
ncbi:hypothetical protein [Amedibacillus sp. YH-ame10]